MESYQIEICGIKRNLPIVYLGPKLRIASLSLLGDVNLVSAVSREMLNRLKDVKFDYFVGPEVKVVPLLYEMTRQTGRERYIVCRKAIKGYMVKPLILHPSNSMHKLRSLVIDGVDQELIKGKKVVLVDDVVTTGTTISAVSELMQKAGAEVVAVCSVLKQGDVTINNLIFLGHLPVFKD